MSKKKKKHQQYTAPASSLPSPPVPRPSIPSTPVIPVPQNLSFDSMEDRIRGEEKMMEEEGKKLKEEHTIKKKLQDVEVDRRLDELRKQLGLKK